MRMGALTERAWQITVSEDGQNSIIICPGANLQLIPYDLDPNMDVWAGKTSPIYPHTPLMTRIHNLVEAAQPIPSFVVGP